MEEVCQGHPEKSTDLMGKLSILYVRFWVENVPHGLHHQSDVTDFVAMCFRKKLKMPALGNMMNNGQTGFSVLIGDYLSLTGVILSEKFISYYRHPMKVKNDRKSLTLSLPS